MLGESWLADGAAAPTPLIRAPASATTMVTSLVEALEARGLVCVVGAGGKKTTLYRLATLISRAVVTTTVRIPHFDEQVNRVHVTQDPVGALASTTDWPVGVVPGREETRYTGYDPETVAAIARSDLADAILVKADGARTRWLKAPNASEPRIPKTADAVIPIASARIVGEPLDDEHVHRPGLVAELTGLELGESISPRDVATVLVSSNGGLKGVPAGATVVPLINMVDDAGLETVGREIAARVLDSPQVSHVVLARMVADDPVVAILE